MAVPSPLSRSLIKDNCQKSETNLLTLPLEIVHLFAHHLSPADTACLALCNHFLLTALGKQTLSRPQQNGELATFLIKLTRDLPAYFFCYECSRLHLCDQVGPPGPALRPHNRLPCISRYGLEFRNYFNAHSVGSHTGYHLTFPHVQLAMKRYRHGIEHGVSTESLSFVEINVSNKAQNPREMTTLLSVEARLCPESSSLCLRIQQWAFLRSTDLDKLLASCESLAICDHLMELTSDISRLVRSEIGPRCTDIKNPISTAVHKCRECKTDFQVEIRMVGDEGLGLVITKWIDLGSGLTPKDAVWIQYRKIPGIRGSGVPGNVRLRFDSEPGLSHDDLSSRNEAYLVGERSRKVLDRWGSKTWILQAGRRMSLLKRFKTPEDIFLIEVTVAVCIYSAAGLIYWLSILWLG